MNTTIRVLRIKDLIAKIGIARSTIYDWMNPTSPRFNPSFPKRMKIGLSTIGWLEHEVDAWITEQSMQRL